MTSTHSKTDSPKSTNFTSNIKTRNMAKAFWAVYQFYIEKKEPIE